METLSLVVLLFVVLVVLAGTALIASACWTLWQVARTNWKWARVRRELRDAARAGGTLRWP